MALKDIAMGTLSGIRTGLDPVGAERAWRERMHEQQLAEQRNLRGERWEREDVLREAAIKREADMLAAKRAYGEKKAETAFGRQKKLMRLGASLRPEVPQFTARQKFLLRQGIKNIDAKYMEKPTWGGKPYLTTDPGRLEERQKEIDDLLEQTLLAQPGPKLGEKQPTKKPGAQPTPTPTAPVEVAPSPEAAAMVDDLLTGEDIGGSVEVLGSKIQATPGWERLPPERRRQILGEINSRLQAQGKLHVKRTPTLIERALQSPYVRALGAF